LLIFSKFYNLKTIRKPSVGRQQIYYEYYVLLINPHTMLLYLLLKL